MVSGFRGALGSATVFAFRDCLCLVGSLSLVELLPWFNHTVDGMGILALVRAVLIG